MNLSVRFSNPKSPNPFWSKIVYSANNFLNIWQILKKIRMVKNSTFKEWNNWNTSPPIKLNVHVYYMHTWPKINTLYYILFHIFNFFLGIHYFLKYIQRLLVWYTCAPLQIRTNVVLMQIFTSSPVYAKVNSMHPYNFQSINMDMSWVFYFFHFLFGFSFSY